MNAREPRYRYSRPASEDRDSLFDRLLWSREDHPIFERVLVAIVGSLIAIEVFYQIALAVARGVHAVVP